MTSTTALVERLRDAGHNGFRGYETAEDIREAADLIEAQAAEIETLRPLASNTSPRHARMDRRQIHSANAQRKPRPNATPR